MVKEFSVHSRNEYLSLASNEFYDLIVIGGGITGAGIALDAASRGLKTILLEKNDFSSGTSSKSTKLIHGGLRYLKQFEIALVREVGRERAIVHRLAPHLVTSEKMLLPLTEDGTFGKLMTSVGLMVYDILAGVESADQRVMLDEKETMEKEPLLDRDEILGGGLYAEYRTDDSRLTIEVIKTAVASGALCLNYVEVVDFSHEGDIVNGVIAKDKFGQKNIKISAKKVVSAAGPWVDELRSKDGSLQGKTLHLTKGVHLVFEREKLPIQQAVYFDVHDGRMIFAIPRGKITYVGTTDTNYSGNKNKILTEHKDAQYLIDAVNNTFEGIKLTRDDVSSSWAGVRPLIHEEGKSASELSRKDEIFESSSGLISIAGGKLTGYRKMAERITDLVFEKLNQEDGRKFVDCKTGKLHLSGGPFENEDNVGHYRGQLVKTLALNNIDPYYGWYLTATYGRQSDSILNIFEETKNDYEDADLALLIAELKFSVAQEFVTKTMDFLTRRTGRLFFDISSVKKYGEEVIKCMGSLLNWPEERLASEREELQEAVYEASEIFKQ